VFLEEDAGSPFVLPGEEHGGDLPAALTRRPLQQPPSPELSLGLSGGAADPEGSPGGGAGQGLGLAAAAEEDQGWLQRLCPGSDRG
jgi:hypothetical protein